MALLVGALLLLAAAKGSVAASLASDDAGRLASLRTHKAPAHLHTSSFSSGELFNDDRIAVVVYAPSIHSRQLKCEAAIESLRSLGRWGGRIYLVTEQVKCYQHERWTQCGLDADIVVVDDPLKTKAARKWMLYGGSSWELVKDRLMRAQLWDLLNPPEGIQMLMYMHGCDTLVGGTLQPFMEQALEQLQHTAANMVQLDSQVATAAAAGSSTQIEGGPESIAEAAGAGSTAAQQASKQGRGSTDVAGAGSAEEHEPASKATSHAHAQEKAHRQSEVQPLAKGPMVVIATPPNGKVNPKWSAEKLAGKQLDSLSWGGSIWAIHRQASAPLLEAWSRAVLLVPDASQARLLSAAVTHLDRQCRSSDACVASHVAIKWEWSQALECEEDDGCEKTLPIAFNHLPPSVCVSFDHAAVSDWVESLDLCVYQNLGYCPPLLMTPFALAWLPYPKCAKLELGLSKLSCQWSCTETSFIRTPSFRTIVTPRTLPIPFKGMRP